jgi:hypothetical protein
VHWGGATVLVRSFVVVLEEAGTWQDFARLMAPSAATLAESTLRAMQEGATPRATRAG